jgi:hypothetical protein
MHSIFRPAVVLLGFAALFASSIAQAQWVMLARHVVGRVEQMSQQSSQSGGANYDTASVMLEAPADKVFATVVRGVKNAQGISVTREDPSSMLIQFTNGQQIAGIKVSSAGDNVTQLLISSAHTGNQQNAAALVLNSVLRVCKDMNVECK